MEQEKRYIAVDLGAESGRVMLGIIKESKLHLQEAYRFPNGPIEQAGHLHWDFNKLLSEVKTGIKKAIKQANGKIAGIGVDSWGVDFGLLDENGQLIENPYHYRDSRTNGMMEKAFELMDKRQIYENTGLQFMQINSIYQLLAMQLENSACLARAKKLIFIADLVSYYLCGAAYAEYTLASTSQLMDMRTGQWSKVVFDKLSLPIEIMPDIVKPGTVVGQLTPKITDEGAHKAGTQLGNEPIPVIAVASHDTASAVAAVPAQGSCGRETRDEKRETSWSYISSGTWSLVGVEVPQAIINDKTFVYPFTNEGGVENTIRLLKNVMGLWLIQECKRQWAREGIEISYNEMTEMAKKARPFVAHIDPDYNGFLPPGDMPKRINNYLARTGQQTIDNKGQMIRVILEGLALKYRWVIEALEDIIGKVIDCVHIVGGGSQNQLLCQFTADALGKKVIAGPVEATAIGNVLMAARATGQIKSLSELRKIIRNSFELKEYQPEDVSLWEKQYKLVSGNW